MKWILKVEICLCVRLDFGFNFGFFLCVFSGLFHCRFRSFYFGVATICVACSKEGHTYVCFLLCLGDFAGCHNAAVILGRELFAPAKRITSHCGRCRMRSSSRRRRSVIAIQNLSGQRQRQKVSTVLKDICRPIRLFWWERRSRNRFLIIEKIYERHNLVRILQVFIGIPPKGWSNLNISSSFWEQKII